MELDFINELCESRLIRTKNLLKKFTARDVADLAFLYICALVIMKNDFTFAPAASEYAAKTLRAGATFPQFRVNGTDLYIMLQTLVGKDDSAELLLNQEASQILVKNIRKNIRPLETRMFLMRTVKGTDDIRKDATYLFRVEKQLSVKNGQYKAIRRLASDWVNLKHGQRMLVVTRILQALRTRAPRSELLPLMTRMARMRKFEIKGARDMEKARPGSSTVGKRTKAGLYALAPIGGLALGYALGKKLSGSHRYQGSLDNEERRRH